MQTHEIETKIVSPVKIQSWIDDYTRWASHCSPLTPNHFHQNIALTIACANIARRVHVQLPHEKLYPNVYTLIVAVTTVHAKTTAFNLARRVIRETMADRILTSISTPEAFADTLAGHKPSSFSDLPDEVQSEWTDRSKWGARRLFMLDEAGRFFNALQKDYNATLDALLMELYDSSDEPIDRETRKDGLIRIEKPSLSCLFATTPGNVRRLLGNRDSWSDGFWNRWNFVTVDQPQAWRITDTIEIPIKIINKLNRVSDELGEPGEDRPASITDKLKTAYYEFAKGMRELVIKESDERLHGVLGRLPTKRMKAALTFAVMENPKRPEINIDHWNATEEFSLGWQRDALMAIDQTHRTDRSDLESRAWATLVEFRDKGITARRIQQILNRSAGEINPMIEGWVRAGTVQKKTVGRTCVYLPNED